MVGNLMKCEQAQHVIGDLKHFALNDQETGRNIVNAIISERALQESDLLAFHIAINIANPGAVMCSYNRINGNYACENRISCATPSSGIGVSRDLFSLIGVVRTAPKRHFNGS